MAFSGLFRRNQGFSALRPGLCRATERPNGGGSTMADAVCKIIDLQNEIAADMDRLGQIKKDIVDVIGKVDDVKFRILLEKRYLCSETW